MAELDHYEREQQIDDFTHYHQNDTGPRPSPPKDPEFWCEEHQRPLTYAESRYEGDGALCGWCRDPSILEGAKRAFDDPDDKPRVPRPRSPKSAGSRVGAAKKPAYTSWE